MKFEAKAKLTDAKSPSIVAEASEDGRGELDRHSGYLIGLATKRAGDPAPNTLYSGIRGIQYSFY
ncbi:hypothetical protein VrSk94_00910 [Vibrio rotiferianus]